eukprot:3139870-Rhodomonas_salina.1
MSAPDSAPRDRSFAVRTGNGAMIASHGLKKDARLCCQSPLSIELSVDNSLSRVAQCRHEI